MANNNISVHFQEEISKYRNQGYLLVEQFSQTSVALSKKRFFGIIKKPLYLWVDGLSIQGSEQSFSDLTRKLSENVRQQKIVQTKVSWTNDIRKGEFRTSDQQFQKLLLDEYHQNLRTLNNLKEENLALKKEIDLRNCLGKMAAPLKNEVERCLNEGYVVKSYSDCSAILERSTFSPQGAIKLGLIIGSAGKVERSHADCPSLQARLDSLILLFNAYRKFARAPGREKKILDKQFELDTEIDALQMEMKYLGCSPNLGDHIPSKAEAAPPAKPTKQIAAVDKRFGTVRQCQTVCIICGKPIIFLLPDGPIQGKRSFVVNKHECDKCGGTFYATTMEEENAILARNCEVVDGAVRFVGSVDIDIRENFNITFFFKNGITFDPSKKCRMTPLVFGKRADGKLSLMTHEEIQEALKARKGKC